MSPPPDAAESRSVWSPRREFLWKQDAPALLALGALAAYFVALSWRKWPDPLIDFGRELYTPWRIANGAVLYRDVDAIYGPLSQLFDAALFRVFGPGLMVLVAANLVVFAAILALLHGLLRRAFGFLAATLACGVFVAVFGFSQLVVIGNYNFAAPYAHEVTHGFLACLLLVSALERWLEEASTRRALVAGLLLGVTAVLKPEFMLAGAVVTLAAAVLRVRRAGRPAFAEVAAWLAAAALPTLACAGWFLRDLSAGEALSAACRAWLNVFDSTFTGAGIQRHFLGLDEPWKHGVEHAEAAGAALALIAAVALAVGLAARAASGAAKHAVPVALVAAAGWISWSFVDWRFGGRCLLGLIVAYALVRVAAAWRARTSDAPAVREKRLLLALLAAAFMLRMGLNARFGQYGFWQAALAGTLAPAVLLGELPAWVRAGGGARPIALAGVLALVGPGVLAVAKESRGFLEAKTLPIGQGRDRFYAFPKDKLPTGEIVRVFSTELAKEPAGDSLLVLPEGVLLNYLARMPSTVAPFLFFSFATAAGREAELVKQLEQRPPKWIAVLSRDLREYGVQRYGESEGHGKLLLDWVNANYSVAARLGGDPLDVAQFGGTLWQRKSSARR